ncbi:hypothetical protein KCP75_20220 [Salmonella enterica subsp. enterica]|nr:hypothetical protein KCP75_20220 [Salmonella enterica subsp. enterica]
MDGRGERFPSAAGDGNRAINQEEASSPGMTVLVIFVSSSLFCAILSNCLRGRCPTAEAIVHHGGKRIIRGITNDFAPPSFSPVASRSS